MGLLGPWVNERNSKPLLEVKSAAVSKSDFRKIIIRTSVWRYILPDLELANLEKKKKALFFKVYTWPYLAIFVFRKKTIVRKTYYENNDLQSLLWYLHLSSTRQNLFVFRETGLPCITHELLSENASKEQYWIQSQTLIRCSDIKQNSAEMNFSPLM